MIDPTLPLIELHRHLDGSVRLATVLDLARKHCLPLPADDLEGLRPYVQVSTPQPGIMAFIERFEWQVGVLADYESVRRVAYENVEDAQRDGLDYIELRFSPLFMSLPHRLDPAEVTTAVVEGALAGERDFGVKVGLIGILSRTYGVEGAEKELQALLTQKDHLRALDLAGDEAHFPAEWFRDHFRQARAVGWHVTVHAGEIAGAESIWEALKDLGAERIGHALRAVDDPRLLDYMREHRIGVESCLTSNVQTSCVESYAVHPLLRFLQAGIPATINTDDPGISGIDLAYEYNVAAAQAGLGKAECRQAQRNALEVAFLTAEEREELRSKKG
jgi:adenosine deaminase